MKKVFMVKSPSVGVENQRSTVPGVPGVPGLPISPAIANQPGSWITRQRGQSTPGEKHGGHIQFFWMALVVFVGKHNIKECYCLGPFNLQWRRLLQKE